MLTYVHRGSGTLAQAASFGQVDGPAHHAHTTSEPIRFFCRWLPDTQQLVDDLQSQGSLPELRGLDNQGSRDTLELQKAIADMPIETDRRECG